MRNKNINKIRINLLPLDDKERLEKNKKRITTLFLLAIYLFFIFLFDFVVYYKNNSKKSYVSNLQQRFMIYKNRNIINETLMSAIESKKKLKKAFEKKITIVNNLKKLKINWNKKIGGVINASPKGVWMNSFLLQNAIITINGNSLTLNELALYIDKLKNTKMFQKIILFSVNRKIINDNTFYSFKLNAYLPYYKKPNSTKK